MPGWSIRRFSGMAPRVAPRLLADDAAKLARNVWLKSGSLVPLKSNTTLATLPKAGNIQTIYRFGQDLNSETNYWFHWAADVNVVKGFVAGDTQERTYYTDGVLPKVTDNTTALSGGGTSYPNASYTLGVPNPTTAPVAVKGGTPTSATAVAEDRVYVVTLVTAWGEEGAPSDASNIVSVKPGETVSLSLPSTVAGNFNYATKRIYRSVPGTSGTPYLFVAEVTAATTTYVDSKTGAQLGETLPSLYYEMPPAGLQGLTAGPGGVMAGFVGRDIYFCEPFKPHAWPSSYVLTVDFEVVAIACYDTNWVVLTKGAPYIISGADPTNYVMSRNDLKQACVSKRSAVAVDGGVIFASPDGLFFIGGASTRNLTENLFTRSEWQSFNPSTINGYFVDNTYVGFYNASLGFTLDLTTGSFSVLDWAASAGYYDPIVDQLFLVTNNNQLVKFNTGSNLTATWTSKEFYSPVPTTMAAARVEAAGYPVTFSVYADGVLKSTQTVSNGDVFRLPSGFRAHSWYFTVTSAYTVYSAGIATSVSELKNG